MNEETKNHVITFLEKDIRFDGRKLEEYRKVTLEYGISKNAEGSARVKIGDTEVLAGVKLSVGEPFPDTPDKGVLIVGVELLPMSSPKFDLGPPGIQAIELARVVDRGIRESGALDVEKLCIEKRKKVWLVIIDIITINDDGNLFDAASLAAFAALKDTKFPKYDGNEINYKEKTSKTLPIQKEPVGITIVKIGDKLIVDPTTEEEEVLDARLTVTTTTDGTICAMQKGGDVPLSSEETL